MYYELERLEKRWVKSDTGIVAGVCEGLGKGFNIDPWVLRICLLISIFVFQFGVLLYVLAIFALPNEYELAESDDKKVLGVCSSLSEILGLETGLIRLVALFMLFASFGFGLVVYLGVYLYLATTDRLLES